MAEDGLVSIEWATLATCCIACDVRQVRWVLVIRLRKSWTDGSVNLRSTS
jgi:hypothetical protein